MDSFAAVLPWYSTMYEMECELMSHADVEVFTVTVEYVCL
jgi:hypothetical protein